jgi:hypothetical protein
MIEKQKQDILIESILKRLGKEELDTEALEEINNALRLPESSDENIDKSLSTLEYDYIKKNLGSREVPFKDSTEVGEAFGNLDNNSFIDFNSRLSEPEIAAINVFDELQNFGVFPKEAKLTQQFKRLKVSLEGKGRQDKVNIVTGQRAANSSQGFFDLFKRKNKENADEPTKPTG